MIVMALGCRAGLPPEPPGRDAADAEAEVPSYVPGPNPLSTSAFAGERLGGGGHAHGHHGHHGGHAKPSEAQPAPPASAEPHHDHGGHGKADEAQPEPPATPQSETRR